ncbi:MAG TPA: YCF48-related protein [Candidatus Acidoferrum sp.]|nr:YCF48-related protein [Candidatus Acidoferrum sp.]
MPSDDRDTKFERALAQHLRGGQAQANCPDAETLAAYHERNLTLEEMARWKEHISACEACQEAMALVETAEKQLAAEWEDRGVPALEEAAMTRVLAGSSPNRSVPAAAAAEPKAAGAPVAVMRRRPALLRWAIPLGAVAAGVLVFIGIYEQRAAKVAQYSDTIVARRDAGPTSAPALDDQNNKIQREPEAKDQRLATAEVSRQKTEQEAPAASVTKSVARAKESDEEGRTSRDQIAAGRLEKKKLSSAAPAPKIQVQAGSDTVVAENAPAIAAAPAQAPPPPVPPAGAGMGGGIPAQRARAPADAKDVPSSLAQTVTVESAAPAPDTSTSTMKFKQGLANEVVGFNSPAFGLILTPDNKVFWKLQPAGTLQLTTDGGKKWKSLDTGANANLTAGFAPSAKVCWIAGKAGTLVLTTDRGGHWTAIATPITGDLGGVRATDAKHASIWDAAKHVSYETSDGGASWKQTASE